MRGVRALCTFVHWLMVPVATCQPGWIRDISIRHEINSLKEEHNSFRRSAWARSMQELAWNEDLFAQAQMMSRKCEEPKHDESAVVWVRRKEADDSKRPFARDYLATLIDSDVQYLSCDQELIECRFKQQLLVAEASLFACSFANCTNLSTRQLFNLLICVYDIILPKRTAPFEPASNDAPPCSACATAFPYCNEGLCTANSSYPKFPSNDEGHAETFMQLETMVIIISCTVGAVVLIIVVLMLVLLRKRLCHYSNRKCHKPVALMPEQPSATTNYEYCMPRSNRSNRTTVDDRIDAQSINSDVYYEIIN